MGAQNFNFAPKFPQTGFFFSANLAFLDRNFPTRRQFSDSPKFREAIAPPPAATDNERFYPCILAVASAAFWRIFLAFVGLDGNHA